jgi:hypothetical protein
MTPLTVTRVLFKQDLRAIHKIRKRVRCGKGQAWLFVNSAETMARLVDSERSVHCYWAPKGHKIDVVMLAEMVAALRLQLVLGDAAKAKVGKGAMKIAA